MDINQLLDMLELEYPEEFRYFENLADLLECEQEIEYEALYQLLSKVEVHTLKELVEGYFEDIINNMPDDSVEIFTLMETIKQMLVGILGLIQNEDEEAQMGLFVDEIYKLREWYTRDGMVHCTSTDHKKKIDTSICQAFYMNRLEKLNEERYFYDFSDCLAYEIEEYAMPLTPMIEEDEEDEDLVDLYDDAKDHYGDELVDDNY